MAWGAHHLRADPSLKFTNGHTAAAVRRRLWRVRVGGPETGPSSVEWHDVELLADTARLARSRLGGDTIGRCDGVRAPGDDELIERAELANGDVATRFVLQANGCTCSGKPKLNATGDPRSRPLRSSVEETDRFRDVVLLRVEAAGRQQQRARLDGVGIGAQGTLAVRK